jgi:protein O-mannosyl-transferase
MGPVSNILSDRDSDRTATGMTTVPHNDRASTLAVAAALVLVTCAAWCRVARNDFVQFDDNVYITDNVHVQQGISAASMKWAFWNDSFYASNWHPLTWLSHMLDWQMFGPLAGGHHMVSLLLHVLNTLLLLWFLRNVTRNLWASATVAALFALHPMHVESVAWASERKDVLSTLFWLATMLAYAFYTKKPSLLRYLWVMLLLALGLMSKPMVVTLPIVLLLMDYWPLERTDGRWRTLGRLFVEKVPLLLVAASSCIVTLLAQSRAVRSLETIDLATRLTNAAASYGWYLWKTVWPIGLSVYYPYPATPPYPAAVLAVLTILVLTAAAVHFGRHRRYLLVGWLWYLVTLIPVSGIVQVGMQAHADRYTYIPYIGIFIAAAWLVAELVQQRPSFGVAAAIAASVILLLCGIVTWRQVGCWRDGITLFSSSLANTSDNYVMQTNLGIALAAHGDVNDAIPHLEESLRIKPGDARTLDAMGTLLAGRGQYADSLDMYLKAAQADSGQYGPPFNAGVTLVRMGQHAEALPYLRRAVELRPDWAEAYMHLGIAQAASGDETAAISSLGQAVALKPELWKAHIQLADIYVKQGTWLPAAEQFRQALRLKTDYETLNNLAGTLVQAGRLQEAEVYYRQAIAVSPSKTGAYCNLAVVLARQGNVTQAVELLNKVLEIEPGNETAGRYLNMLKSGR